MEGAETVMPKKFIVLTTQRSGSNYFCFWLNNHPQIRCHSELFLKKYIGRDGFTYHCTSDILRRPLYALFCNHISAKFPGNLVVDRLIQDFYQSLLDNPQHSGPITDDEDIGLRGHFHLREKLGERAVGFKLMYDQLELYAPLRKLIKDEKLSILHLIRENTLKILVSRLTTRKRGVAHSVQKVKEIKIWIDPQTVFKRLSIIFESQERMKSMFSTNPYLEICSEDVFSHYRQAAKKVFEFLGVEEYEVRKPVLKKLNPDSLREIIENYDEINEVLKNTRYERFFD